MNKKIGLVAWPTGPNSFGATIPYIEFFSKFGIVELIMPNETNIRDLDLLVLPGGPDVETNRYLGEEPLHFAIGKSCPFRERFDKVLLPKYLNNRTPIFGICRGHQSLAVEFGAQLEQHMYHETNKETNRIERVHKVIVNAFNAELIPGLSSVDFRVNSIHHQVVLDENLPNEIKVLARYTPEIRENDGEIEAITYFPEYPAHTVQWHPEEIEDDFSIHLINHLLNL